VRLCEKRNNSIHCKDADDTMKKLKKREKTLLEVTSYNKIPIFFRKSLYLLSKKQ
jgi:hypothetical protein